MLTIEQVAEVCHETNRAYCAQLGDLSQPEWTDAPEWQKRSAINGVIFHRNNPDASPSASHESWLEEKRRDGWSYGPVKDPGRKLHPCFVPFTGLPLEQQAKDKLFKGIVDALRDLITPAEPLKAPTP
jgi:RyR domain